MLFKTPHRIVVSEPTPANQAKINVTAVWSMRTLFYQSSSPVAKLTVVNQERRRGAPYVVRMLSPRTLLPASAADEAASVTISGARRFLRLEQKQRAALNDTCRKAVCMQPVPVALSWAARLTCLSLSTLVTSVHLRLQHIGRLYSHKGLSLTKLTVWSKRRRIND